MAVNVEVLEKLQRRVTLTLSASEIASEVDTRLKKLSRTVKASGFRPGKVPMSVVAQRYGYSVQYEVLNDRVGKAFSDAAQQAGLRVAGTPRIEQKDGASDGHLAFDAIFEVYPEVRIGDLSACEIERVSSEVTEEAIDRTIDILRKQRRSFSQRPAADGAQDTDRVTIDFSGTIDGAPFSGGQAEGFQFVIGEGQMLPQFDQAVRGMRVGDSKTFPLQFPADYHGQEVAGKEADFLVTMKKVEVTHLPEVDEAFVRSLGVSDGGVDALRADVRRNLERELGFRVMARNKAAVLDALVQVSELDLPRALVDVEVERLTESTRATMRERGVKDSEKVTLPPEMFMAQAERRVRLGLIMSELVRVEGLRAKPDQLQQHLEEIAQSYEKPSEVMRHYLGDRQRMAEIEAVVVENNVTAHVLSRARVTAKVLPFDQVMAAA
jgi:trigger factor